MRDPSFKVLNKISYILRFYRRLKGYSQAEMAEALQISPRNFQRLEMGEVEPKLETLGRIAKFLELPISSLIRMTELDEFSIAEVSSSAERVAYHELQQVLTTSQEDLQFVHRMIELDKKQMPAESSRMAAEIKGTVATMTEDLAKLIGFENTVVDVQPYALRASTVERWELIFRYGLTEALIETMYAFPKGFKVLQHFHYKLNPNPDNPTSSMYVRDVTDRHTMSEWLNKLSATETV